MGCCGGRGTSRSRSRAPVPAAASAQTMTARTGFRLVEYIGGNTGSMTFMGPATEKRYRFGDNSRDRIGYVDAEDLEGLLAMRRGRKHLFRIYRTVTKKVAEPEPETILEGPQVSDNGAHEEIGATKSARKLAVELGIDLNDVEGTGRGGRILKGDVEEFAAEMVE